MEEFVYACKLLLSNAKSLFYAEQKAMQRTPQEEGPVGSMPNAANHECYQQVKVIAQPTHAIASKRNIHIILKPCGERYVPTMPKLTYGSSKVGTSEVLHQAESHHACHTNGNQRVACKITVYLEREQQGCYQIGTSVVLVNVVKNGINIDSTTVSQCQLHEIAPHHQLYT